MEQLVTDQALVALLCMWVAKKKMHLIALWLNLYIPGLDCEYNINIQRFGEWEGTPFEMEKELRLETYPIAKGTFLIRYDVVRMVSPESYTSIISTKNFQRYSKLILYLYMEQFEYKEEIKSIFSIRRKPSTYERKLSMNKIKYRWLFLISRTQISDWTIWKGELLGWLLLPGKKTRWCFLSLHAWHSKLERDFNDKNYCSLSGRCDLTDNATCRPIY